MPDAWRGIFGIDELPAEAVRRYREFAAQKTELERQAEGAREDRRVHRRVRRSTRRTASTIPIFVADYVLMGYGTGAIMAVPAHDQRDFEFAQEFELPDRRRRAAARRLAARPRPRRRTRPRDEWPEAYVGDGVGDARRRTTRCRSTVCRRAEAKRRITEWLEETGSGAPAVTYKLRDWLFSRQRYWGEPFPIVYDEHDLPGRGAGVDAAGRAARDDRLRAAASSPTTTPRPPEPPLARADDWVIVELDLGDGPKRVPARDQHDAAVGGLVLVLPALPRPDQRERRSSIPRSSGTGWARAPDGGVDLYVGGAEHAVLHLLYARFWHKVLFDLGHVSTPEPFHRLFNQGTITAAAYTDERGVYVDAAEVEERDGEYVLRRRTRSPATTGRWARA